MPRVDERFEELLAALLEEPNEILGILSDVVQQGRIEADDLDAELLRSLAGLDLVTFLVEKRPRRATHTWVYPTPLGLRVYATLEREAERVTDPQPPTPPRQRSRARRKKGEEKKR